MGMKIAHPYLITHRKCMPVVDHSSCVVSNRGASMLLRLQNVFLVGMQSIWPRIRASCREALRGSSILVVAFSLASMAIARPHPSRAGTGETFGGTLSVLPSKEFDNGKLVGCGFQFSAMNQYPRTESGAAVKIVGSYHLRLYPPAEIGYSLKLGIYEGLSWTHPYAPHSAYARPLRGAAPSSVSRLPAENPGFALFFGFLTESPERVQIEIVDNAKLIVGFNQGSDHQDIVFILNLHVENTQIVEGRMVRKTSSKAIENFSACADDLIGSTKK